MTDLRNAFKKAVGAVFTGSTKTAILGKLLPDGTYEVDVPGQNNVVYIQHVTTEGSTLDNALNKGASRKGGKEILIQEAMMDPEARAANVNWVVVGEITLGDADESGDSESSIPPHTHMIGSGLDYPLESRRWLPGLVFRSASGDLVARVKSFWHRTTTGALKLFGGGTIDLTSYRPATAYHWAWCVIGINPASNAIVAVTGTSQAVDVPLTQALIEAVAWNASHIPLAAVRLRNGQASLPIDTADDNDWKDLRNFVAGGGGVDLSSPPPIGDVNPNTGAFEGLSNIISTTGRLEHTFNNRLIMTYAEGSSVALPMMLQLRRANGNIASPSGITSGQQIGKAAFAGHNGSDYAESASITAHAEETPSVSARGTSLRFVVTKNGGTSTLTSILQHYGAWALPALTSNPSAGNGDMWYNATALRWFVHMGSIQQALSTAIYTQYGNATVANSTSESGLITVGVGTLTLPANMPQGRIARITARGYYSATGSATLTLRLKFGGTTYYTLTLTPTGSSRGWRLSADVLFASTPSASASVWVQGEGGFGNTIEITANTAAQTLDTSTTQAITLTAQWGTASPSNTLTITHLMTELLN